MTNDNIQYFVKESLFEQALVDLLPHHGWEKEVLVQPTEEDLIQNWAKILFDNNRDINKLGNYPLTASEMRQIIDQVNLCDSPYAMNMFINGGQVCIKRDNPTDTNNYGKEVLITSPRRSPPNQCRTKSLPDCSPTSFQGFAPVRR